MPDEFPYVVYWSNGDTHRRCAKRSTAFLYAGSVGGYFRFEPRNSA